MTQRESVPQTWTPETLRAEVEAFLRAQHTVTLATVDDAGGAHAASLLYAPDGLALIWTSDANTRHSQHLAARPAVAATIAPDYEDFRAIRGLQIHGRAERLSQPAHLERASALLLERYAFLGKLAEGPPALREAWQRAAFYRLAPRRIALIDNTRGFGHKAALEVGPAGESNVAVARET
jgi:uncharacterized protein YhbP (UPF0306 family)